MASSTEARGPGEHPTFVVARVEAISGRLLAASSTATRLHGTPASWFVADRKAGSHGSDNDLEARGVHDYEMGGIQRDCLSIRWKFPVLHLRGASVAIPYLATDLLR